MIKKRHFIHCYICRYYGILDCEKWYEHQPEPITESKRATFLWNCANLIDRKIKNKPDIVVNGTKRKTYLLIDMTVSTDNKISVKEYDEINKTTWK